MFNLWWNVVIFFFCCAHFVPTCLINFHLSQWFPKMTLTSCQKQPMISFSSGGPRLINCKTIRYIITISNAKYTLLCDYARFSVSVSVIQHDYTTEKVISAVTLKCKAAVSICSVSTSCWFYSDIVNNLSALPSNGCWCKDFTPCTKKSH